MLKKKDKNQDVNKDIPAYENTKRAKVAKVVKIVVPIVLVLVLAFIIFEVATSDGHKVVFKKDGLESSRQLAATDTSKGINGQMLQDQGMTLVAENDFLKLSFSNKENLFIIEDKINGEVFRSYPEPIYEQGLEEGGASDVAAYDLSTETGQFITSPVFVGYTKSGMDGGFVLGVNQMPHVKTVYFIENGIRLHYEMKELELEFSVEITIEDNELVYRVPVNGIIERETYEWEEEDRRPLLMSISVLPYLGAHRSTQKGYFVVPDGSGALTYFDVPRITNYNEYSKHVYGTDQTFDTSENPSYNDQIVSIGAYGIVENMDGDGENNINVSANSMMTSFIVEGDADADLKISNPGIRSLPFYAIYFQYNYRNFYKLQISNSGTQYDMVVKDMQIGDVEQRIRIDTSENETYSYVNVAKIVQNKLIDQWNARYGESVSLGSANADVPVMNVKMFMGAENISGGVLNQLTVMTDYEDVQNIYNELSEMGAPEIRISLLGWQNDGYFWNSTTKLKPDSSYGSKGDFKDLLKWAKDKGIELSLDNNLLIVYGEPKNGATLRNSIVKSANTFYVNYWRRSTSGMFLADGEYYIMSPDYFEQELLEDAIERLTDYGASNVDLQQLGNMVYSDYNEEHPLHRIQSINRYVQWLRSYGEKFDKLAVYNGNAYAVPFVDTIVDMPVGTSSQIVLDDDIPFMQLVYHGIVNYYSLPVNSQPYEEFYTLKSIEYGSLMSYEITEQETSELFYTYYDSLYRSEYNNLKEEIVERYNITNEAVKPFASLEMTDHYRVDDDYDVFCTEYSDGTKVYVCYETGNVSVTDSTNGRTISFDGNGYQILQKGGE